MSKKKIRCETQIDDDVYVNNVINSLAFSTNNCGNTDLEQIDKISSELTVNVQ